MQIERHVELFDHLPERPVLLEVVVHGRVEVADLREAVDQRALESKLLDAALQLARRQIGILHRQRRQSLKAVRPLRHLLGQIVVGLAGDLVRLPGIRNALDGRRVERQQHHLDAVLVHQSNPPVVQIEHAGPHLLPHLVGKEAFGIV